MGTKTTLRLAYVYCQMQTEHEIENICYQNVVVHSHRFSLIFLPVFLSPPVVSKQISATHKSLYDR